MVVSVTLDMNQDFIIKNTYDSMISIYVTYWQDWLLVFFFLVPLLPVLLILDFVILTNIELV